MTAEDLRALILAAGLTTGEMARRLGMNPRHLRRMASGEQPISPSLAAEIHALFGAGEEPSPYYPRDRWIVGEGPPPERREYVIHTAVPRFIARVVAVDEFTGQPEPDEEPADLTSGIVYGCGEARLCEIQWIDPAPSDPMALTYLIDEAADQLEWDV